MEATPLSRASEQDIQDIFLKAGVGELPRGAFRQFAEYLELLKKWNSRFNLTGTQGSEDIVPRHFAECAFAAQHLPESVVTLLDFGSGAGFPGLPFAICRPTLSVTLAEAHGKKAAFLREVTRSLGLKAEVFDARVETMPASRVFDIISLRAVENLDLAIAYGLRHTRKWLVLFSTIQMIERDRSSAKRSGRAVIWMDPIALPNSEQRVLILGKLADGS